MKQIIGQRKESIPEYGVQSRPGKYRNVYGKYRNVYRVEHNCSKYGEVFQTMEYVRIQSGADNRSKHGESILTMSAIPSRNV